jgi:hypothetical protein
MHDPWWLIDGRRAPFAGRFQGTRRSRPLETRSAGESGLFGILLPMLLGALLLAGCGGRGTEPDVAEGRFTAYVQGAVTDTLRGTVHARHRDSSLVGLELGDEGGPGLSIELEPHPPALRRYDVVDAELFQMDREGTSPEAIVLLQLEEAHFEATDGTFDLTYVGEDQIGATFTLQMNGAFIEGGGDAVSVEVTGELSAPSPL